MSGSNYLFVSGILNTCHGNGGLPLYTSHENSSFAKREIEMLGSEL